MNFDEHDDFQSDIEHSSDDDVHSESSEFEDSDTQNVPHSVVSLEAIKNLTSIRKLLAAMINEPNVKHDVAKDFSYNNTEALRTYEAALGIIYE